MVRKQTVTENLLDPFVRTFSIPGTLFLIPIYWWLYNGTDAAHFDYSVYLSCFPAHCGI